MARKETRERILDVAEKYFADEGYHGASLRAITTRAQANLAAVNYHFGSKEGLAREVIGRRLIPLNERRIERLKAVKEKAALTGVAPKTEDVLLAFIKPTIEFRDSYPGAPAFITIIHRAIAESDNIIHNTFMELIEPVIQLFIEVMGEALPHIPQNILHRRVFLTIGVMAHTMMGIGCPKGDQKEAASRESPDLDVIMPYVKAGMEAPF